MKCKTILFVAFVVGIVLLAGCTKSSSSGYATYNPQQGQGGQQQGYVGGGCGVAPVDNLGESSASIDSVPSNL